MTPALAPRMTDSLLASTMRTVMTKTGMSAFPKNSLSQMSVGA
jgi:hypothetical protein